MQQNYRSLKFVAMLSFAGLFVPLSGTLYGQKKTPMVRLAKIVVDSSRLEEYKAVLIEEAQKTFFRDIRSC